MRYVIVDPCGDYPAHILSFLSSRDRKGIGVFTTRARQLVWEHKWEARNPDTIVDSYLIDEETPIEAVAKAILATDSGGLSGIIPWDEISVLEGAILGDLLGVDWNSTETILRCRDKHLLKTWLRNNSKERINQSATAADDTEAQSFAASLGTWPIVVKPTGGSGSEHVYFAKSEGELNWCCQQVLQSDAGEVLLEEYIDGPEYAINGQVDVDGKLQITDVWLYDKRWSHGIPNLYYQSIKISSNDPMFSQLVPYANGIVRDLKLKRTPVHMEVKVDQDGPCLIEIGTRFAGGNQPLLASKLHGRSLFELAACHYLASFQGKPDDLDFSRYDQVAARVISGIQAYEIPRISTIHGLDEVEAVPSFDGFGLMRPPGTPGPLTQNLETKAWEVYLRHPDPVQVAYDARVVRSLLHYE